MVKFLRISEVLNLRNNPRTCDLVNWSAGISVTLLASRLMSCGNQGHVNDPCGTLLACCRIVLPLAPQPLKVIAIKQDRIVALAIFLIEPVILFLHFVNLLFGV